MFDTRGGYVGTVGRNGQGPGEYGYPMGLGLVGDTLAVIDPANIRIDLFRADGRSVGQWPYPPAGSPAFAAFQTSPQEFWARSVRLVGEVPQAIFVRYARGGASDTVPAESEPSDAGREPKNVVQCKGKGHIKGYGAPFAPHAYRVPGPDGLIVQTDEVGYRLVFLTTSGDTARIVERVTDDAGMTDEQWNRAEAAFKAWRGGLSGVQCTPSGLQRPRLQRLIDAVFPDADGRVWVERRSSADSTHSFFDAFGADGVLLGTLRTPRRASRALPAVRGDRFYVATLDSLDVPKVYGFRIGTG